MALGKKNLYPTGFALCFLLSFTAFSQNQQIHFKSGYAKSDVGYLISLPSNYKTSKNQGAVIFLHPGSSAGSDLNKLKTQIPENLVKGCKESSLLLIAPQLPVALANRWPEDLINEFLDDAIKKFKIDIDRIYITGFGKGGGATWDYIIKYPDRVTAAIPIGGYGNPHSICKAKAIPILAFHGGLDTSVPPQTSRELTRTLHRCNGKIHYTEYPKLGYECWKETYANPNIYKWMASKNKKDSTYQQVTDDFMLDKSLKAYKLPLSLQNIGGILYTDQNRIFAVNESGNQPYIFEIDTFAHVKQLIKLDQAINLEWRDLSSDDSGNILIGDIGNTSGKRTTFQIYILPLREIYGQAAKMIPEKIEFTLPNETFVNSHKWNFESFIWFQNNYYLFGTQDNKIYVFKVTYGQPIAELIKVANIPLNVTASFRVTSADMSRDFKTLALLGEEDMLILSGFTGEDFFGGTVSAVKYGFKSAKSGVAFINSSKVLISERNESGLYEPRLIVLPVSH
jgi:hypothetical protein